MGDPRRGQSNQTAGAPSAASDAFRRWHAREAASRRIDVRSPLGSARNPAVAANSGESARLPLGSFYYDTRGGIRWRGPRGDVLAGRTDQPGAPGPLGFLDQAGEAAMQVDTAVRAAADSLTLGWADEADAAYRATFSTGSPAQLGARYDWNMQANEARAGYDDAQRPVARSIGSAAGTAAGLALGAPRLAGVAVNGAVRLAPTIGRTVVAGGLLGAIAGAGAPRPGQSRMSAANDGLIAGAVTAPAMHVGAEIALGVVPRLAERVSRNLARQVGPRIDSSLLLQRQRNPPPVPPGQPKIPASGDVYRNEARDIFARINGIRATSLGEYRVHHRIPLEYSYLFPIQNPNRSSNLIGLHLFDHHDVHDNYWTPFRQRFRNRQPTASDVMREAIRIDQLIAGRIFTPGRSTTRHTRKRLLLGARRQR